METVINAPDWQRELQNAIHNPLDLLKLLELSASSEMFLAPRFKVRVPAGYVARMRKGDPHDPLLRQVLPVTEEQTQHPHFSLDPLGEASAEKLPGLLHKYHGRVLLVTTKACAIHCRYCFRQHFNYQPLQVATALEMIRADTSIREVILSGGDPLMLTDDRLADLAQNLASITHLQRLRVHSRLPIVLPERVTPALIAWLTGTRLQPILVIHANHANELDNQVNHALQYLVKSGVTVLNQSVLLRNINDNAPALIALSEALFKNQVLPYYLHLLDRVQGTAHFEVPVETALTLLEQMRIALPGYLVPKLVREVVGMAYKQSVG